MAQAESDVTSGEKVSVPVGLLTALGREYLTGDCSIKGGWGDSETIEALLNLVPPAQMVRSMLPDSVWEVTVWLADSNYIHGVVDGADRTRIIDAVAAALRETRAGEGGS